MSGVVQAATSLVVVLALVATAAVLARTRDVLTALHVLLGLLLAAGLLRLVDDPTWRQIVVAAVIVALRRLVSSSLASTAAALRGPETRPRPG